MSALETVKTNSAELIIKLQKTVKALDDTMLNGVTHASLAVAKEVQAVADELRAIVHIEHHDKEKAEAARIQARTEAQPVAQAPAVAAPVAPETAPAATVAPAG